MKRWERRSRDGRGWKNEVKEEFVVSEDRNQRINEREEEEERG